MTSKTFVDFTLPAVDAAWLNDVNDSTYGPDAPPGTLRAQLLASGGAAMIGYGAGTVGSKLDELVASPEDTALRGDLAAATGSDLVKYGTISVSNHFKTYLGRLVASVAALKLLDKTKFTHATTTGYYATSDGGGGDYCYDAADTTSPDNGGTVLIAADGGRWKFNGKPTVATFGAIGDYNGTTGRDNTVPLQAAIDAGVSTLGAGRYKVTGSLVMRPGMCLEGDGEYRTIIEMTSALPIFVNDPAAVPDFARTNFSRLTLRGGTFAHKYTLAGVNVQSLGDWNRVRFENQTIRGIDCDQYFIANNFYNCVWFYSTGGVQCGKFANLNNFVNCRFEGMASNTIVFLDGAPPGSPGPVRGGEVNTFLGCRFEARNSPLVDAGFSMALLKTCTNTVFDGCYIEDTWRTVLAEEGASYYGTTVFRNCKFSGQEVGVAPAGPKSERFLSDGLVTLDNNFFEFGTINSSTAKFHLIGTNQGLNTLNSLLVLDAPQAESGRVLTKPWAPTSGVPLAMLRVTRPDLTASPSNHSAVSGRLRLVVSGTDAGGVPFALNRDYPFVVTGLAAAVMTLTLGAPDLAENNSPGAVVDVTAAGATASQLDLSVTVTAAGMISCVVRTEIEWRISFQEAFLRPVVTIL